jgi:hypothetical protein
MRIQAAERFFFRICKGLQYNRRNEDLMREQGILSLTQNTKENRWKQKQHLQRMNITHIPKQAMTYEVCSKRDVGRQRKRWTVMTVAETG